MYVAKCLNQRRARSFCPSYYIQLLYLFAVRGEKKACFALFDRCCCDGVVLFTGGPRVNKTNVGAVGGFTAFTSSVWDTAVQNTSY